jgi:hypothetical protein
MKGILTTANKRRLLVAAEVALVAAILGLLVLTWLPAIVGARLGSAR